MANHIAMCKSINIVYLVTMLNRSDPACFSTFYCSTIPRVNNIERTLLLLTLDYTLSLL